MKSLLGVLALTIIFVLVALTGGYAADKKITKKQIPDAVLKAFTSQYPDAIIKGQALETESGKKYYEIESLDGNTRRDILFTPDGKAYEIEETMDPATLSDALKSAVAKKYPKGKIEIVEKVTRDTLIGYEMTVKIGKKTKGVNFDAKGNMIKVSKNKAGKETGTKNNKGGEKVD